MTIRESTYFIYDGKKSYEMGLYNVTTKNGMYEEIFLPSRSIIEQKIRGKPQRYFIGFEYEPIKFSLEFAFFKEYTSYSIREVARWLLQDDYKPLMFNENLDRVFYGMFIDDSQLVHNGLKEGFLQLNFYCDSPFAYTPVKEEIFDLSNNETSKFIQLENTGDLVTRPEIWITKTNGNGDIKIKNYTNSGKELILTGLQDQEEIYLDCKNEDIVSNLPNIYRFDNHNDNWLDLVFGKNTLEITGKCYIRFRFDAPLIQG